LPFRRRSKFIIVISLSLCVTVLKLLSTNATIGSLQALGGAEVDGYRPSLHLDGQPLAGRGQQSTGSRGVLAEPDCEALMAGDRRETSLTEAMLYRENVHHLLIGDGNDDDRRVPPRNCSPTWFQRRGFRLGEPSTVGATPSHRRQTTAYVVTVDAGSTLEQTLTVLGALYSPLNAYCVATRTAVASRDLRRALRQIARCLTNVVTSEEFTNCRPCPSGHRSCSCAQNFSGIVDGQGAAEWKCVQKLMSPVSEWTYLVKLSTFHLPIQSDDAVVDLLQQRPIQPEVHPTASKGVDIESLNLTDGRAYSRHTVGQLLERRGRSAQNAAERPQFHSPDGSTVTANAANRTIHSGDGNQSSSMPASNSAMPVIELSTDKRCDNTGLGSPQQRFGCVYTVADLPRLARLMTPFAYPFDVKRDHFVMRCILRRRTDLNSHRLPLGSELSRDYSARFGSNQLD
jgi:hypothetical protein